jgi:hypothetical protein
MGEWGGIHSGGIELRDGMYDAYEPLTALALWETNTSVERSCFILLLLLLCAVVVVVGSVGSVSVVCMLVCVCAFGVAAVADDCV